MSLHVTVLGSHDVGDDVGDDVITCSELSVVVVAAAMEQSAVEDRYTLICNEPLSLICTVLVLSSVK